MEQPPWQLLRLKWNHLIIESRDAAGKMLIYIPTVYSVSALFMIWQGRENVAYGGSHVLCVSLWHPL